MDEFENKKNGRFGFGALVLSLLIGLLIGLVLMAALFPQALNRPATTPGVSPEPTVTPAPTQSGTANSVADAAEKVLPSVVSVIVEIDSLQKQGGSGSGFIISEDGFIVTNSHVIENAKKIEVILNSGTKHEAQLVGADTTSDIAVLKINAQGLKAAKLGDSSHVRVGEQVMAVGDPFGYKYANTVTVGYISAINRSIEVDGTTRKMLQTDAAINPGNSGGPLVNLKGEIIGITTLKSRISGYDEYGNEINAEGIGFAIPISEAAPIIEALKTKGKIVRPGIGISGSMLNAADAAYLNKVMGILVVGIAKDGPAEKAGILPDDILTEVDGTKIESFSTLKDYILSKQVGDTIKIKAWRNGQVLEFSVVLVDSDSYELE
jgi:serine protease Do